VPEKGSDEPKNVVHSRIALKWCVWRCTWFVFQACICLLGQFVPARRKLRNTCKPLVA